MYNIKVGVTSNGQYYAAGMGIGVENTPSGMQSQVIFLADRFAVTTAAGNSVALPFVIQNGQTFIRASFIQDGTIENAKIGNYIQSNNYVAGSAGWKLDKGERLKLTAWRWREDADIQHAHSYLRQQQRAARQNGVMVMPQGLQCWDGAGRIAVDLSDYAIRYIGSTSVTFAAGETAKTFLFGITRTAHLYQLYRRGGS
jgi:hypothetical protein